MTNLSRKGITLSMTEHVLIHWLSNHFGTNDFTLTPLTGDASFRRYFRIQQAGKNFIAMDASAEKEKCSQFVAIANTLRSQGLCTPEIFTQDIQSGFLLLSDFGNDLYLRQLRAENADALYGHALEALATLSRCKIIEGHSVPPFTARFMREELNHFQEWFLEKHLHLTLTTQTKNKLANAYDLLVDNCASQPQLFMHRDYHSANLMVLPENRVGILDFQDAFIGPLTYDAVSLLRDCYIEWPDEQVQKWALQYRDRVAKNISDSEFLQWFDWMGMQRHLKALLTFSCKYRRDQNAHYLQYIPRTVNYLLQVSSRYPEFNDLHLFLKESVLEQLACAP